MGNLSKVQSVVLDAVEAISELETLSKRIEGSVMRLGDLCAPASTKDELAYLKGQLAERDGQLARAKGDLASLAGKLDEALAELKRYREAAALFAGAVKGK